MEQEEHNQHRDGDHTGEGHDVAPTQGSLAKEGLHSHHQRSVGIATSDQQRPQEVAQVGEKLPDRDGGEDWAGKRNDYLPVDAPMAGSVNKSYLLKNLRDVNEELVEEENGECVGDERDDLNLVAVYPCGSATEPGPLADHQQERHGHRLEGDDNQHHDHDDQELAARERYACQCVGDQAVDQQAQCDDAGDYQHRVEHIQTEGKPLEGVAVVLQRDVAIGEKGIHATQILQELALVDFQ